MQTILIHNLSHGTKQIDDLGSIVISVHPLYQRLLRLVRVSISLTTPYQTPLRRSLNILVLPDGHQARVTLTMRYHLQVIVILSVRRIIIEMVTLVSQIRQEKFVLVHYLRMLSHSTATISLLKLEMVQSEHLPPIHEHILLVQVVTHSSMNVDLLVV